MRWGADRANLIGMNSTTSIHRAGAAVAAAALTGGAITQLTHEQSGTTTVEGWVEHLEVGLLTLACLALVPMVLHLGARARRERISLMAVAGLIGLGALATVSNVRGEDPSFFAAVAIPTNLMIFGGLVTIAVALVRLREVPRPLGIALGAVWPVTLMLSPIGGGLVAAIVWLALAGFVPVTKPATRPALSEA